LTTLPENDVILFFDVNMMVSMDHLTTLHENDVILFFDVNMMISMDKMMNVRGPG